MSVIVAIITVVTVGLLAAASVWLPAIHRGSGLCALVAALAVAGLLGSSEARSTLDPHTWLFLVSFALAVLAWLLRAEAFGRHGEMTETDHKTEVYL